METLAKWPDHVVERANRFRLGMVVEIAPDDLKSWTYDWVGTIATVVGVQASADGSRVNIHLRHDGDTITDGFEPEDLSPSPGVPASVTGGET